MAGKGKQPDGLRKVCTLAALRARFISFLDVATYYDISVPISNGGAVYPGNPPIRIEPQQEMAKGGSSNVSSLSFGSHTGTHVDAPKHMVEGGESVDKLPLDVLMGPAVLVDVGNKCTSVDANALKLHELKDHKRILIKTRNSAFIREPDFREDYTYLAPDAAEYLVSLGVKLVGVDYFSIEQFHSGHHRTHTALLNAGVVIVEGLDLSIPAAGPYELRVLPLRLAGLDGAPARAVLVG